MPWHYTPFDNHIELYMDRLHHLHRSHRYVRLILVYSIQPSGVTQVSAVGTCLPVVHV